MVPVISVIKMCLVNGESESSARLSSDLGIRFLSVSFLWTFSPLIRVWLLGMSSDNYNILSMFVPAGVGTLRILPSICQNIN